MLFEIKHLVHIKLIQRSGSMMLDLISLSQIRLERVGTRWRVRVAGTALQVVVNFLSLYNRVFSLLD